MNKVEFLKELELDLLKMKDSEKSKFIVYYDEMISDYIENGIVEDEAVKKVGAPDKIAQELMGEYDSVKLNLPSFGSKSLNIIITIIGFPLWGSVLLSIALLVLSAYIILWCVPFAAGAGSLGFIASAIVGIVGAPFVIAQSISIGLIQLGSGIASIGISLILGIATVVLTKKFISITKKFNIKLVALFKKKVVIR